MHETQEFIALAQTVKVALGRPASNTVWRQCWAPLRATEPGRVGVV